MNKELIEKDHLYLYAHKDLVDEARATAKNLFDRNAAKPPIREELGDDEEDEED